MKKHLSFFMFLSLFVHAGMIEDYYKNAREQMLEIIQEEVRATSRYLGKNNLDGRVIDAMGSVPRHEFVPLINRMRAYANRPLPIGQGQTISQPYIVAIMTDLLDLKSTDRVLEVGTGSGYQAAVLAKIVNEVYSIEVIEELAKTSEKRLKRLGYTNVKTRSGDGYYGWEKNAPYDAIIVTAAAGHIPPPLIKQLKPGGKMIIPVKSMFYVQHLILVEKDQKGALTTRQILPVRFVPLTGKH